MVRLRAHRSRRGAAPLPPLHRSPLSSRGGTPGRIAVIGDIHGNARALDAACDTATRIGYDALVLMGDLLTYGVDTTAVIERVTELCAARGVTLLRGNHDEEYLSGGYARDPELGPRPDWIQESIDFTRSQLPLDAFRALPFVDEHAAHGIYFAHANPFGAGDWRYLNSIDDHLAALAALRDRGFGLGVFGHTHRARIFNVVEGKARLTLEANASCPLDAGAGWILNAGSVGQPRDRPRTPRVLFLEPARGRVEASFIPFEYDEEAHVRAILAAALPATTRERLVAFHRD